MSEPPLSVTQHQTAASSGEETRPLFFYDLGDPEAYLAAERVMADLPVVPEWVPVDAAGLPGDEGSDAEPDARRASVEALAATRHVQPLRWPATWPGDSRRAMVAATYAKQIGRGVAFALAAFRQGFAGGRELTDDTILIAGAACEMHPNAVTKSLDRASIAAALDAATAHAAATGVRRVPAIAIGDIVFHGDAGIDAAATALEAALDAARR